MITMHCSVLLLFLTILAPTTSGQSNGTAPKITRQSSRGRFYSNSSMGLNSTTAIGGNETTISVPQFYELINSTCKEHISALQTCPKSTSQRDSWLDLAMKVTHCVKNLYDTECHPSEDWSYTTDYPTYRTWVRDHLNMTKIVVEKKEGCEYPDFIPILNAAVDKSMQMGSTANDILSDNSPTICDKLVGKVMTTIPVQYVRCARQNRSPTDITACVLSTVDAVPWISLNFFIYGGQDKKCKTGSQGFAAVLIPMLITFFLELVAFAIDVWLWRRKCKREHEEPPKVFSWIGLCGNLLGGFGTPFLVAYVVYPRSFEASALALVSIFILKPRATPLIAIPAKRLLGTGYGAQLLFVDSLIALSGIIITVLAGLLSTASSGLIPSGLQSATIMYLGLCITFLPFLVIYVIYNICSAFYVVLLGLGLLVYWLTRNSRLLKWAFSILMFWLGLIICFALSPIFALFELGWSIYRSRKKLKGYESVFPLAKFFAKFFDSENGHWLMRIGKRALYYPWCVLMIIVFVGRWMALLNLMAIAGDAFCPASWTETAVAYVFFTLFTIVIPTTLHFFGLSF
ncbi:hypothetical protein BGZ60DRAFT_63696 [Tricladium varicosporioides]|nr:hypothetical protein BGZ60DRAFT_63696 [Hymenoscyphus varicosporioides]